MSDGKEEDAAVSEEADSASSLLYDDVDATSSSPSPLVAAKQAYELQQLRAELAESRRLQQEAAAELERKEAECVRYKSQCALLARNVSLLYATAVSEVKRKNDEIDRLQEWKEAHERRDRQRRLDEQQQQHTAAAAPLLPPAAPPASVPLRPPLRAAVTANNAPMPLPVHSPAPESSSGSVKQGWRSHSPPHAVAASVSPLVPVNWQR